MSTTVFLVVLLAAVLHAGWNAAVRASGDRTQAMIGVTLGHVPYALAVLPFVPWPDAASWRYVIAGALLHLGYQLFLMRSYRTGELTQVYPIARGTAPLLTAIISVAVLGEQLSPLGWAGIVAIAAGLVSLVAVRRDDGIWDSRSAGWAVLTGCFTAAYSVVDGVGARAAGTALGFFAALALVNGALMAIAVELRRPGLVATIVRTGWQRALASAGASFTAFSLVVWGFTQAPIALVAALRETSVVFALLFGVWLLKERLNLAKLVATMTTMSGALLVRLAR